MTYNDLFTTESNKYFPILQTTKYNGVPGEFRKRGHVANKWYNIQLPAKDREKRPNLTELSDRGLEKGWKYVTTLAYFCNEDEDVHLDVYINNSFICLNDGNRPVIYSTKATLSENQDKPLYLDIDFLMNKTTNIEMTRWLAYYVAHTGTPLYNGEPEISGNPEETTNDDTNSEKEIVYNNEGELERPVEAEMKSGGHRLDSTTQQPSSQREPEPTIAPSPSGDEEKLYDTPDIYQKLDFDRIDTPDKYKQDLQLRAYLAKLSGEIFGNTSQIESNRNIYKTDSNKFLRLSLENSFSNVDEILTKIQTYFTQIGYSDIEYDPLNKSFKCPSGSCGTIVDRQGGYHLLYHNRNGTIACIVERRSKNSKTNPERGAIETGWQAFRQIAGYVKNHDGSIKSFGRDDLTVRDDEGNLKFTATGKEIYDSLVVNRRWMKVVPGYYRNVYHIDGNNMYGRCAAELFRGTLLGDAYNYFNGKCVEAKIAGNKEDKLYYGSICQLSVGYMMSALTEYRYLEIAKQIVDYQNKLIDEWCDRLRDAGYQIMGINADGIFYRDYKNLGPYHDENEGLANWWKCDIHATEFCYKSTNTYDWYENGDPNDYHLKASGIPKEKQKESTWKNSIIHNGKDYEIEIFGYNEETNKFEYKKETQIL